MEEPAILFEVKSCKKFNQMQAGLEKACTQIVDQRYREGMLDDGYERVVAYGICFCKKSCVVRVVE